jgi:hypothetical protein
MKRLSRRLTAELARLRPDFAGMASDVQLMFVRRAHLAPPFMAAFSHYQAETGRSFVAFVRELDATMPASDYQGHRSYQAALYLRRLHDAPETTVQHRKTPSPFQLLASATRSLLLLHHAPADVWTAIRKVSRWRDRDVARLERAVLKARPLLVPRDAPRLVKRQERGAA